MMIVAFDPGRNVGVAFVDEDGRFLSGRVVGLADVGSLELPEGATVLVGDGTGSGELLRELRAAGLEPTLVPEAGTSLEGRRLYFEAHPPQGIARVVPKGMRTPPRTVDDYAAYALALRWLTASRAT